MRNEKIGLRLGRDRLLGVEHSLMLYNNKLVMLPRKSQKKANTNVLLSLASFYEN
jgi:hypothetical protein